MSLIIRPFQQTEQEAVRNLVLHIQNIEFGLGFEPQEQPDLLDTQTYFQNGRFWVATMHHEPIGTIGLQALNQEIAVLKKMFVKKAFRGSPHHIAQHLFDTFMSAAEANGYREVILDTPGVAKAAHRFYEKNGFEEVELSQIPEGFEYPDRNSKFYRRVILCS